MTGKSKHCLREARVIIRVNEPQAIHFAASWRNKAHFCHGHALVQQWFLTLEWQGLCGTMWDSLSEEKLSAQMAVAEFIRKNSGQARNTFKERHPPSSVVVPSILENIPRDCWSCPPRCAIFCRSCRRRTSWHGLKSVGLGN